MNKKKDILDVPELDVPEVEMSEIKEVLDADGPFNSKVRMNDGTIKIVKIK